MPLSGPPTVAARHAPPPLPTLDRPPSWHTTDTGRARGKTSPDRSACVTVRASTIAKRLAPDAWQRLTPPTPTPMPKRRSGVGSPTHPVARPLFRGTYTLHAADLLALAAAAPARRLAGDYRTAKSNAMRPPGLTNRQIIRSPHHQMQLPGPDRGLPINPNRPSIKHLFPPEDFAIWRSRDLAIEESKPLQHRDDPSFRQSPDRQITRSPDAFFRGRPWTQTLTLEKHRHHASLVYPYFRCPVTHQRCKMLFLPYATADEFADATIAHRWLHTVFDPAPPLLKTRLHRVAVRLLDRYATLFPPRQLVSRAALSLRYGEARRIAPSD